MRTLFISSMPSNGRKKIQLIAMFDGKQMDFFSGKKGRWYKPHVSARIFIYSMRIDVCTTIVQCAISNLYFFFSLCMFFFSQWVCLWLKEKRTQTCRKKLLSTTNSLESKRNFEKCGRKMIELHCKYSFIECTNQMKPYMSTVNRIWDFFKTEQMS